MQEVKMSKLTELSQNLMGVTETAEILHCKVQTIYNWMTIGKLKRVKIGRKTMVKRSDVEKMLIEAGA